MKKIIFFLFSVVIIVTGALYSAVLYDRIQKKEQKASSMLLINAGITGEVLRFYTVPN